MKYVVIITLLLAVALFLYWRLRPYLKMAGKVLGFVRDVQRMSEGAPRDQSATTRARRSAGRNDGGGAAAERLVRCSSCGTWLPASRAVTLRGSNEAYCSHECMERPAADRPRTKTFRR